MKQNKFEFDTEDYTDITILLDKSSSMGGSEEATLEGLNKFIAEQRELEGNATLTLFQFDDQWEETFEEVNLKDVKILGKEDYQVRGMTKLFDSCAKMIDSTSKRLAKKYKQPKQVLTVVVTDGGENSSTEITKKEQIQAKVIECKEKGWNVIFMGADINAFGEGHSMGIDSGSSYQFSKKTIGKGFDALSSNTSHYRGSSQTGCAVDFFSQVKQEGELDEHDETNLKNWSKSNESSKS